MSERDKSKGTLELVPNIQRIQNALELLRFYSRDQDFDIDAVGSVMGSLQLKLRSGNILVPAEISEIDEINDKLPKPTWWDNFFRTKRYKQYFEATHTLGNKPTVVSSSGWCVYHPIEDPNIAEEERYEEKNSTIYDFRTYLKYEKHGNTYIGFDKYKDHKGRKKPIIEIWHRNLYRHEDEFGHTSYRDRLLEKWILNASVVVIENHDKNVRFYERVRFVNDDNSLCEITSLKLKQT